MGNGKGRGRYLEVNLSTHGVRTFEIASAGQRGLLGGSGLAAALFFELAQSMPDPTAPEAPLVIMTGPLVGTGLPGATRYSVSARSTVNGYWAHDTGTGPFGTALRAAGYDGLVIVGSSHVPLQLVITPDQVALRPADELWGHDTFAVTRYVHQSADPALGPGASLLCIGPAAEAGVEFATLLNDGHFMLGRGGIGRAFGHKRLKLITVKGGRGMPGADNPALAYLAQRWSDMLAAHPRAQVLAAHGTAGWLDEGLDSGLVPFMNWRHAPMPSLAQAVGGRMLSAGYLLRRDTCAGCPIACRRTVAAAGGAGPVVAGEVPGPEYAAAAAFGPLILNGDLVGLLLANEQCYRLGLDPASCGATLAFCIECLEVRDTKPEILGGVSLGWGQIGVVNDLLPAIADAERLADLLGMGAGALTFELGAIHRRYANDVKGLELPPFDPRARPGLALALAVGNFGPTHDEHLALYLEPGPHRYTDAGLDFRYALGASEGRARMHVVSENLGLAGSAAGLCMHVLGMLSAGELADAIRLASGWDAFDVPELLATGQRIWTLQRGLANLAGLRSVHDALPPRLLTPLADGPAAGAAPDLPGLYAEYRTLRGLDERGIPSAEATAQVGLGALEQQLAPLRAYR